MKYEIDTFTIDTSVENGTITEPVEVDYGSSQTIGYEPNEGYHIAHVIVDGEEVDITEHPASYTFENVTSEHTIDVKYEIDTFTIDTSVENGTITEPVEVDYGGSAKVKYSANEDYHLLSIKVDNEDVDVSEFPTRYYTTFDDVDTNHTVEVKYSVDTYSIVTNIENGTITDSCEVESGSSKTIEFAPTSGYHITKVTIDGEDVNFSKLNGKYTLEEIQDNHSIKVVCEKDKEIVQTVANSVASVLPNTGSELFLWVIVIAFIATASFTVSVEMKLRKRYSAKRS